VYLRAFQELLVPLAEHFRPQLLLVSVGFDAHWKDHSSVLGLSVHGYYNLLIGLQELAEANCPGCLVLVLEGGYNIQSSRACALAAFRAIRRESPPLDPFGPCPDAPVAPPDLAFVQLKNFLPFVGKATGRGFYDLPVESPYRLKGT
jgi:hypothetical protein